MSDEDLIGYLFDLLDPDDRAAVAARVEADPEVAARLDRLRAAAAPMLAIAEQEREETPEPPPALAVRAIAKVAQYVVEHEPRQPEPEPAESPVAAFLREYAEEPPELDFNASVLAPAQTPSGSRPAPPPADGPEYRSGFRFRADMLVAACIAFVGIGLVLSGVAKARQNTRDVACQNSLRTFYTGLSGFADHDPQGRYPQVGTP